MILETAAAPPFMTNGFVVGCERTHQGILIDPGDAVQDLLEAATARQIQITGILLTHAHVDHVSGVAEARRRTAAPIWLHKDDLFLYDRAVQYGGLFGLQVEQPPAVDLFYEPGATMPFGDYEVVAHHTPGHCPGGVCLQIGKIGDRSGGLDLFVGDTLFAGSIGRTDLPGGDYDTLIRSIKTVLFAFGDEARVYPGHGPDTTIGHERRTNPFLV